MTRVLIVDDERSIRLTLAEFLRGAGSVVAVAEDVQSARAALAAESWDVVVTDLILPGASGMELLRGIRETAPDVQVVIMTGEPTVDTAAEAVRAGALDYLPKPVTKTAILRAVETAGRVKRLADERSRLAAENRRYQEHLESLVGERTAALEAEIAERARTEERLRRRTGQLETVRETTLEIARELNPDALVELILQRACELIEGSGASLLAYDAETGRLVPHLRSGCMAVLGEYAPRLGEGCAGRVAATRAGEIANGLRGRTDVNAFVLDRVPVTNYIAEPLLLREMLVGVIGVARENGRDFETEDQDILRMFAAQAAIAIGNARLHRSAVLHGERLDALLRASRTIQEGLDFEGTLDRILGEASRMANCPHIKVLLLDPEREILRPAALRGTSMEREHVLRVGEGLSGVVAQTAAPLQVLDVQGDPRNPYRERDALLGIRSYLGLPIMVRGRLAGVLSFSPTERTRYSPEEVAYLTAFADQAAVAIENSRLYAAVNRRAERLRLLNRLTNRLATTLDSRGVVQEILDAVGSLLPGTVTQLWAEQAEGEGLRLVAVRAPQEVRAEMTRELPRGQGLVGWAVTRREVTLAEDVRTDPRFVNHDWARRHALGAAIALPLFHRDCIEGALAVLGPESRRFDQEDVALIRALADQAAIALGHARLFRSLQEQHGQLRQLWHRLSEIEEAERQRLSRELHDQVGQSLTALSLNLTLLGNLIVADPGAEIARRLGDSQELVQETVTRIRGVMAELRPPVLDDWGLAAALRWYAGRLAERTGVAVTVQAEETARRRDRAVETAVFRIAQEALTNVAKHAQAAHATVSLVESEGGLRLTVEDDGRGVEPRRHAAGEGLPHWGILSMRERIEAIGGTFRFESSPGQGTRVMVEVRPRLGEGGPAAAGDERTARQTD